MLGISFAFCLVPFASSQQAISMLDSLISGQLATTEANLSKSRRSSIKGKTPKTGQLVKD
jgi:hypothetical protein